VAMGFTGLPRKLSEWITGSGLSATQLIAVLTLFYIVLGCFLDGISMIVLTVSVVLPSIQKAGIDTLWFGIFVIIVVEMAQVTPPVGFNLFVVEGITGESMMRIARASLPFFLLMIAAVAILMAFPQIVSLIPDSMTKG